MKSRKKKSRPEWIAEVEDIKAEIRETKEIYNLKKQTHEKNSTYCFNIGFSHGDSRSNIQVQKPSHQCYNPDRVKLFCKEFEWQSFKSNSAHSFQEFSVLEKCHVPSLQLSCLDAISSNLERYSEENLQLVLAMLPSFYSSILSAMCCRKNQLTNCNMSIFAHEHISTLFIGGSRVTDDGIDNLLLALQERLSPPLACVRVPATPESWEDLDLNAFRSTNNEFCGPLHLQSLIILSPHITTEGLMRILSAAALTSLRTVTLHGACSAGVVSHSAAAKSDISTHETAFLRSIFFL